jgi:transposase
MPSIQEQILEINTPGPENASDFNVKKISDLDKLALIAKGNTDKLRKLQMIQASLAENDPQQTGLNNAIVTRQQMGVRLRNRREEIRRDQAQTRITQLEETLRPTSGLLNNQRRELLDQMIKLVEKIRQLQGKFEDDPGNGPQRRLLARLTQWERTLSSAVMVLDRLPPLPSDLER